MKIGLDLDDVIVDFFPVLLNYHNKKYNRSDKQEDFKEFKWWPVWGIGMEEAVNRVNEFHETFSLEEIKPVKDAVNSINKLSNLYELLIITSRPTKFKNKSESWILHHLKKQIRIISAGDFHKGQGATKAEICLEFGIELMLEDAPETAVDCANKCIKVILFDKPWNQGCEHENIIKVFNWKEAMKEIDRLENGSRRN